MIELTPDDAMDPVRFMDACVQFNEKGKPWTASRYQRRVLAVMFRRHFPLRLWSEIKKSGKTFLAAVLVLWWGFTHAHTEIIVAANDLEQSVSRVFKTVVDLLKANPELGAAATILREEIRLSNGTVITAIASDYRGAAGSRHSLVVFDELWGFDSERAQRLYEELTLPPTEPDAWVLVVTYAGFTGESVLLETMYQRGLAGERVEEDLELYEADGLVMFWSHTPRQPWQTSAYYAEQARSLRAGTFARLHRNEWVSPESRFLTAELWDACVTPDHHPLLPTRAVSLYVGVDASVKHDSSAVVAVYRDGARLALACHKIWRPSPERPMDFEASIEAYLRELHAGYRVEAVFVDPFQMHRSIVTLAAAGLKIGEFAQTTPNTTRMGEVLFDVVKGRNLVLYADADLREQALNTVGIESARGTRIAKERASKKIDAIVALAMACVAALDAPVHAPVTPASIAAWATSALALRRDSYWREYS